LVLITCLFFGACNENDLPGVIKDDDNEIDYSDCNAVFPSNILIDTVLSDSSYVHLLKDNGDTLTFSSKCISSFNYDYENTQINLVYYDSSSVGIPMSVEPEDIKIDTLIVNPSGNAPLCAVLKVSSQFKTTIRMSIAPKSELSAEISHFFDEPSYTHEIPVFGLYKNYLNQVELEVFDVNGNLKTTKTIDIQTQNNSVRIISGSMTLIKNNFNTSQRNRLFLVQNAIYDGNGDIRWYTTQMGAKYYRFTNGVIAIQMHSDKDVNGTGPDILLINLMGEILESYYVPNNMHHEINEKTPGGNLLVASNSYLPTGGSFNVPEDMAVEIDRNSGQVVKEWDLTQIFDPNRPRIRNEGEADWCHLNSIEYDPSDNSLLISSKLQCFIAKIDYDSGNILWILGNHNNWDTPWQEYLLTPENFDSTLSKDYDWTYAQHMPRLTPRGSILVYDNGLKRPGKEFARAVEYSVDTTDMTVKKLWTYDLTESALMMGSIEEYDDNTIHFGHAVDGQVMDIDKSTGEVLFQGNLLLYYRSYPIQFYE